MKILQIIESLGRAGAEQALVNILPTLQGRGHQCEVAVLWPPYHLAENLQSAGIVVHRLDLNYRWNLAKGITKLTSLCRQCQYDAIHAHLFFAALYAATSRPLAPVPRRIVSFHNLGYDSYPATTLWKKVRKALDGWLMRHWLDGWTAVSQGSAQHYQMHLGLSDIVVIPNAFPVDILAPNGVVNRDAVLSKYGVSSQDFAIVVPGRLVPEKGHRYLLQALKLLGEKGVSPKVLIFGNGPLAQPIAEYIARQGLQGQVIIQPAVPHQELLAIIQATDMLAIASTHEGFGLVAAEAMALKRPVLATRVGGLTELVEEGLSGLLVPPADPVALAEGMVKLIRDPDLRERLGKGGRERIETHFSADAIATQWEKYYQNLIKLYEPQ